MALTMEATHDGPPPLLLLAWSEFLPAGMDQLTCAKFAGSDVCQNLRGPAHYVFPLLTCALSTDRRIWYADVLNRVWGRPQIARILCVVFPGNADVLQQIGQRLMFEAGIDLLCLVRRRGNQLDC